MHTLYQNQLNGMALGGLGTGSVEIMPNGKLDKWQIFNLGKWATTDPEKYHKAEPEDFDCNALRLYARAESDGRVIVRKLSQDNEPTVFRNAMYSFLKNIEKIRWTPCFPICNMEYIDSALPVKISAQFINSFIAGDTRASSNPGFYISFKIKNTSSRRVDFSLLGILKNPFSKSKNTAFTDNDRLSLMIEGTKNGKAEMNGSLCLSACGGESSYILSDYSSYMNAYVFEGELGASEESVLFDFKRFGYIPKIEDNNAAKLHSAYSPYRRIFQTTPELFDTAKGRRKFTAILDKNVKAIEKNGSGDSAICNKITLEPDEQKEIMLTLCWCFPEHYSIKTGKLIGHYYSNFYDNAKAVSDYLFESKDKILPAVRSFSQQVNKEDIFSKAYSPQLSTLIKCSWYAKNGDFAIWEGLGSCGFNTTDVLYYASPMLADLFSDLFSHMLEMGLKFQKPDGRVYHCLQFDFENVDDSFERVDMNEQFVQMVCLSYIKSGDKEFLQKMWEPVKRAISYIEALDTNGDALPDKNTGKSSYDSWKMRGTPTYVAVIWLGALNSAVYLAEQIGDSTALSHYEELLTKGKKSILKLFNGEYFNLWVDGDEADTCCMSSQLDGFWFNRIIGLDDFIDEKYVRSSIDSIYRYNYTEDCGLVNATYPNSSEAILFTYLNVQAEANWSGIEYAIASLLLEFGEADKAEKIVTDVVNRYERLGRIFNHEECGGHYFRPLSAYTLIKQSDNKPQKAVERRS